MHCARTIIAVIVVAYLFSCSLQSMDRKQAPIDQEQLKLLGTYTLVAAHLGNYKVGKDNVFMDFWKKYIESEDTQFKNNLITYEGKKGTLLHIAARNYNDHMLSTLFKYGAGIALNHQHQETQETPLLAALRYNKTQYTVSKLLIQAGANPNIQDMKGQTSLHAAISSRCHPDIVRLLLEAKADPTIQDKDGNNAPALACKVLKEAEKETFCEWFCLCRCYDTLHMQHIINLLQPKSS